MFYKHIQRVSNWKKVSREGSSLPVSEWNFTIIWGKIVSWEVHLKYFITFCLSWNSNLFNNRYIATSLTNCFHGLIHAKKLFKKFKLKAFNFFIALWIIANNPYLSLLPCKVFIFHEVNGGWTFWGAQSKNATNFNIQLLLVVKWWKFFFDRLTYKDWSWTT